MKPYPTENLFLMTAKKKVTPASKSKTANTKGAPSKSPDKSKSAVAKTAVKKVTKKDAPKKVTKAPPAKSKATVKKSTPAKTTQRTSSTKPVTSAKNNKGVKKAQIKKTTTATSGKSKQVTKKAPVKKVLAKKPPAKAKDSNNISKVKEIISKSLGKSTKDDTKAESNSFSFDDVLGFLKSKKNQKSKRQSSQASTDTKVAKVAKKKEKKQAKVKKITTASIDDILGFGTPAVGANRPLRNESKVPKQWLPYYNMLMSLRAALKGSLDQRSSETIGASARESGELSINSSDAGTDTFDRDLAISMVANDQEALEEIEDAIDRIFLGTYGICLETNKPINKNRLKAVPFTRFSVEGQNQFERGKIKERDFGAGSFATLADSTMGEED